MTGAIIFGFRLLAASQVVLTLLLLWRADLPRRTRVIGGALLVAVLAYLMIPLAAAYLAEPTLVLIELLANLVPALLLLAVWDMFGDEEQPALWLLCVLGIYCIWALVFLLLGDSAPRWYLWLGQLSKVCLIGLALWLTWRGRGNDLITERLQFRSYFCGAVGAVAGAIV